jgi:DNA-binding NarL/FixJ family response regulator
MNKRIRLFLADDHAVVREGIRALLEQHGDIAVVGEASDRDSALREVRWLCPDLLMVDAKMPGIGLVEAIRELKTITPEIHVLVFTSYADALLVRDALEAGATGYLLKDALADDLVRAVREVAAGRAWLHPQAQRQMLDWIRRPSSPVDALTAREYSVLQLLAEGMSNKQIARRLALTEGTVKGYVSQVLDKLGVADRTQAALLAHRVGISGGPRERP